MGIPQGIQEHSNYALLLVLLMVAGGAALFGRRAAIAAYLTPDLEEHTREIDSLPEHRLPIYILLASALALFAELMIIRIHSSYFQFFGYFKNLTLLSCFLGLGIGFARGERRPLSTPLFMPVLAFQILFLFLLRYTFFAYALTNPISEQSSLGLTIFRGWDANTFTYSFLCLIFAFNVLCFIPPGQLCSRLMMRTGKLEGYSWNLLGSLLGIFLYTVLCFAWTAPPFWLMVCGMLTVPFVRSSARGLLLTLLPLAVLLGFMSVSFKHEEMDIYSPYQVITFSGRDGSLALKVNNVYYQRILDLSRSPGCVADLKDETQIHYTLPYCLKPAPPRVLIVGSGTGNDVAAALRNGGQLIDAVEIDPAVLELGRQVHPEHPYGDPKVIMHNMDARAFIRTAQGRYDLIVYGLLDSHTLMSSAASVRLDSYVYTVEAFREARAILADRGLLCVSFAIAHKDLAAKMYLMLREAFDGRPPLVYKTGYDQGVTFCAGEGSVGANTAGFIAPQADGEYAKSAQQVQVSTDDWPFFYMMKRRYPFSYVFMIALVIVLSLAMLKTFEPQHVAIRLAPFFLGAAFMLVETKAITELALLFGSTWIVVAVVISAILTMAFLANMLVLKNRGIPENAAYALLLLSLLGGYLAGPWLHGSLNLDAARIVGTTLLTVPVFFSGFVFSSALRSSPSVAVAMYSNLLGAMIGGVLEYNAMYFGYSFLYLLAAAIYLAAYLSRKQ